MIVSHGEVDDRAAEIKLLANLREAANRGLSKTTALEKLGATNEQKRYEQADQSNPTQPTAHCTLQSDARIHECRLVNNSFTFESVRTSCTTTWFFSLSVTSKFRHSKLLHK